MMGILFAIVAAPVVGLFLGILAWAIWQKHSALQRGGV